METITVRELVGYLSGLERLNRIDSKLIKFRLEYEKAFLELLVGKKNEN